MSEKLIQLHKGDKVTYGNHTKVGVVSEVDDFGVAITWTYAGGWTDTPWYDAAELLRFGIEYVAEVEATLAQEAYQVELEESA